jgi:xylulokinase
VLFLQKHDEKQRTVKAGAPGQTDSSYTGKPGKKFLLGIDIGTTGTKCTVYTGDGSVVAHAYEEYSMLHPESGWTEQDPQIWWQAVQHNLRRALAADKTIAGQIAAISVSCTNALTLVDKAGEPVYNAIGHHDQRADDQVAWLKERVGATKFVQITGNQLVKGSFCLPNLRWLIDNRPELMTKVYKLLMPSGFIIQKLTGVFSMNRPRISLTALADIKTGTWSEEIVEKAEIPKAWLPEIFAPTDIVGQVSESAADLTGLAVGTPVTAGCLDTVVATAGSGAVEAGDFAITLGSSGRICYISRKPFFDKHVLNCFSPFEGLYTVIQTTDNAGISLRWFRDQFGGVLQKKADLAGKSVYNVMNELVSKTEPGAGGIIYLPYLAGEKSPIWNPQARGVFFGIGLESSYGDFVRAVMEGVAFSLKDCLDLLQDENVTAKGAIPLGGGVAKSSIWCQIIADVLQRPILKLKYTETETLGDMILAGMSVGMPGIDRKFGRKMAAKGELVEPNPARAELYEQQFKKYKKLYARVKDLF